MHVEEWGSGSRAVVAVHGWAGTHRDFRPIAARMPPDYRVLSVDLPGCGRSPAPEEWTMDAVIEPVWRLVGSLNDPTTVVVGFCSGAYIALTIAARSPRQVGRAVLIDPLLSLPWYFRLFSYGSFGEQAYRATFRSALGRRITNTALQQRQGRDADFTAAFADADHDVTLRYMRVFARVQVCGTQPFRSVQAPVAVCYGERTLGAVRRCVEDLRNALPCVRTYELERSGHLPLVRCARQLAAVVSDDAPRTAGK